MDVLEKIWHTVCEAKKGGAFFMIKVTRPMKSPGRPRLPEEIKDQVVQAYNQGGNCKAITARYGIGKSTFYRIIKERQEENR